jgi:hypothetical protein
VFRYVAFVGDDTAGELSRLTARVSSTASDWLKAFDAPRLRVLCRGTRIGSSEVYRLEGDAGVVAGKLFETAAALGQASRPVPPEIDASETGAILASAGAG